MKDFYSEHQDLLHEHQTLALERAQQRSPASEAAWQRLSDYMDRLRNHGRRLREHSQVLTTWSNDLPRRTG